MSDVAGTPLPTTGTTTQSSPNNTGYKSFIDGGGGDGWLDCNGDGVSSGSSTNDSNWNPVAATAHSPPFTGTTNGFQVTEGEYLETTATNICTKVMYPSSIVFWLEYNPYPTQPRSWWNGVSDDRNMTSNTYVKSDQFLELFSASYVLEGYVPPNPFGEQPLEGRPYYKVMITARVSGQPNYQTDDIVSLTSQETWIQGYMPTAFRVEPTSSNPCQQYSSAPALVVPVMPSLPTYLPATGPITQGTVGGGSIGFIAGGGGDGWNGCPGGTSGSSDDSNWNPVAATAHAPTFTSTSGVIPPQIPGYPLPSSGSTATSTCPNDGWLSFIAGGGGDGWNGCPGGTSGSSDDSNWNQKVPNVHAPTYIETNHPGGFGIDRTYPGDPNNALPGGGHNWEIKYTVHQIQYETVNCYNGAVTGQINYNSPDRYHFVYDSVSSHPVSVRIIANTGRITSTGCSAPQGWNITSMVVPLAVEVTYTGTNSGTFYTQISANTATTWDNGTLGGVNTSGIDDDKWITIIHVKRDGVIQ